MHCFAVIVVGCCGFIHGSAVMGGIRFRVIQGMELDIRFE